MSRPAGSPDASDLPTPGGAVGSAAAESHRPDDRSGARGVRVPEPEEILREDHEPGQTGQATWDADTGDRDSDPGHRTGGRSDDDRPSDEDG